MQNSNLTLCFYQITVISVLFYSYVYFAKNNTIPSIGVILSILIIALSFLRIERLKGKVSNFNDRLKNHIIFIIFPLSIVIFYYILK